MVSENRNLVNESLIKKILINDVKDMSNAVNSIMQLYETEPILMKCMVEFTKSTNLCQHFFLKGFKIGQASVRNQLDGALEDLIDIKSAMNPDGELPFTDMDDSPEENPESFF